MPQVLAIIWLAADLLELCRLFTYSAVLYSVPVEDSGNEWWLVWPNFFPAYWGITDKIVKYLKCIMWWFKTP